MLLAFRHIHKAFGQVEVLYDIDLSLVAGEVLGLVGENGAGKSTLMNILGGILPPSSGDMVLEGKAYVPRSAREALDRGIAFMHQELNLFPNLSLTENLMLQDFPQKRRAGMPFIAWRQAANRARQLLEQVGLDLPPQTLAGSLSPAQKQLLEIARALGTNPRILIFDEPTTALTRPEIETLFGLIRQMRSRNIGIIYISHNLEDVMHLADRVAILRDGRLTGIQSRQSGYDRPGMICSMVGRDMEELIPRRKGSPGTEVLLSVEDFSADGVVDRVSFRIQQGEILGCYGLVGAGRSEVARMIYGLDPYRSGSLKWKGKPVADPSPADWIEKKVAFLTEDRREEGLLLDLNIEKNIRLAGMPRFARSALRWIRFGAANQAAQRQASAARVQSQSLTAQSVSTLSGGNQQKVVLARWLLIEPELLILDEPTKGIDIGAKHEIYRLINERVDQGTSVLLISSEIKELMGLCDRILVMSRGRIKAECCPSGWSIPP